MAKYKRTYLACGIGIDDDTLPMLIYKGDGSGETIIRDVQRVWRSMLTRCYSPTYHKTGETYTDCEVYEPWLRFSNFQKWFDQQPFEKGMQLDKDIIIEGNKIYSPETCVFLPEHINKFICDCGMKKGKFRMGIVEEKSRPEARRWRASCRDTTVKKSSFLCRVPKPQTAHENWRSYKEMMANRYADELERNHPNSPKYKQAADALRLRYSYKHWYRDYEGELPEDLTGKYPDPTKVVDTNH